MLFLHRVEPAQTNQPKMVLVVLRFLGHVAPAGNAASKSSNPAAMRLSKTLQVRRNHIGLLLPACE